MFSVLVAGLQAAAQVLSYPPGGKKFAHFAPEEGFRLQGWLPAAARRGSIRAVTAERSL